MASTPRTSTLRDRRAAAALTQSELARRAGVSRQLVAAVEAGHNMPSVDAAIRLAQALSCTVEDLFAARESPLCSAVGDPLRDGVPLRVGRVGERLVAASLPEAATAAEAWVVADGVLEQGSLRLFAGAMLDGMLVAGCEPALGTAEAMLGGLGQASVRAVFAPTGRALAALRQGYVHAAAVHGPERELPAPEMPVARIHLARWRVGVALGPGVRARTVEEALAGPWPLVQREPAAVSQQALARAARRVGASVPSGPLAHGHLDAARRAAVMGCAAVTTEPAASALGLEFLALEDHVVELWVAEQWRTHPGVEALGNLLDGRAFRDRLAPFGGYDLSGCGAVQSPS